ncbi:MAG TPA: DUF6134 family protein [Burkholderiaceae bacterium]|nr:DUF6134 family protein [Burkholderiaceae bacterium]
MPFSSVDTGITFEPMPMPMPMPMRRIASILSFGLLACAMLLTCEAAEARQWKFQVTLDGKPIGQHLFTVTQDGAQTVVASAADYQVKMLGLPVYHYMHRSDEDWARGCLSRIEAHTDDNGKASQVSGEASGTDFSWEARVGTSAPTDAHAPCVMTFAYWNPAIADRHALLDPETGKLVPVQVSALPATQIDVHGEPKSARGLRIVGLEHGIDVWYVGDEWVGLDSTVAGGRALRYRLP